MWYKSEKSFCFWKGATSCCSCQPGKNSLNVMLGPWNWKSLVGQVLAWDQLPCVAPHELLHTLLREDEGRDDMSDSPIAQVFIFQTMQESITSLFSKHPLTLLHKTKKKKVKLYSNPFQFRELLSNIGKETTLSSVLERCFPIHCLGPPPNVHTLSLSPAFLRNSNRKVFVAEQLGL